MRVHRSLCFLSPCLFYCSTTTCAFPGHACSKQPVLSHGRVCKNFSWCFWPLLHLEVSVYSSLCCPWSVCLCCQPMQPKSICSAHGHNSATTTWAVAWRVWPTTFCAKCRSVWSIAACAAPGRECLQHPEQPLEVFVLCYTWKCTVYSILCCPGTCLIYSSLFSS